MPCTRGQHASSPHIPYRSSANLTGLFVFMSGTGTNFGETTSASHAAGEQTHILPVLVVQP